MPQTSQTNSYLDEYGSPLLLRSIVAFVDILGYSELCREEPDSLSLLANIRDTLRGAFRSLDPDFGELIGAQRYWMTKSFTDNIGKYFPKAEPHGAYLLRDKTCFGHSGCSIDFQKIKLLVFQNIIDPHDT